MTSRPRVLAIIPGFFPSTVIGIAKPLLHLHLQGLLTLDLRLPFLVNQRHIDRADVVVIGRVLSAQFAKVMDWVIASGTPLIYELDDNLVDIPADIPGLGYARAAEVRRLLLDGLRAAQLVRVYSPDLGDRLREYNANVQLVTGPLEWSLIPEPLPPKDGRRVRLVYATSRAQDGIGALLVRPLRRALEAFPQAELTVWGPDVEGLSDHPRVRRLAHVADYDEFLRRFVAESFDIGLAPLPDDPFHRCKSNNKFREFAAAGVAGLYSDMPVYRPWVAHGETGWLVPDGEEAWFRALQEAIVNPARRAQVADNARRFARDHFNEAITAREWMAAIGPLAGTQTIRDRVPATATTTASSSPNQGARIGRLASGVAGSLKRDGIGTTAKRITGLVKSMRDFVEWERRRRRLERAAVRKGHA